MPYVANINILACGSEDTAICEKEKEAAVKMEQGPHKMLMAHEIVILQQDTLNISMHKYTKLF